MDVFFDFGDTMGRMCQIAIMINRMSGVFIPIKHKTVCTVAHTCTHLVY
jgi:hypothetical protein